MFEIVFSFVSPRVCDGVGGYCFLLNILILYSFVGGFSMQIVGNGDFEKI